MTCPACNQPLVRVEDGQHDDNVHCDCTVVSLEWLREANATTPAQSDVVDELIAKAINHMIEMPVGDRSPRFLINRKEALTILEALRREVRAARAAIASIPVEQEGLVERMRAQLFVWEDEEPVENWPLYQREYAEAFLALGGKRP